MEKIVFIDLKKANYYHGLDKNEVRLKLSGKDKRLVFNQRMTRELQKKKHTHVNVGVGEETGSVYLVFNNTTGYPIPDPKKYKTFTLRGKDLTNFLSEHFKLKEDTQLVVSDNQAKVNDYTTYVLSLPKAAKPAEKPAVKEEKKKPGRKKKEVASVEPVQEVPSDIQTLDAPVEDILKLNGDDLKDLGVGINEMTKNTINKFGSLGEVYASDPDELIHEERGVGRKKVTFLQSVFNGLGLNWKGQSV